MAVNGLLLRLNSQGYKNWIKAGQCLLMLKDSLQGFVASEMTTFHRDLCSRIPASARRPAAARCQCRAQGKQFHPGCAVCAEWKNLILHHHTNRNGEIHWENCNPSLWSTHYWEVAKAYMPRGHANKKGPEVCDAAALLNLMNACDRFRAYNQSTVREVIKCRNDLMHSSDMAVSSNWMKDFGNKLQKLISELKHVPRIKEEHYKIQVVLSSDWFVEDCFYEVDGSAPRPVAQASSSSRYDNIFDNIYDVEKQLLQELLEETYLQTEEQGELTEKDLDTLKAIKMFVSDDRDLQSYLQADIEKLERLQSVNPALGGKGSSCSEMNCI